MHKVISGGQTGADQGALRAARTLGIETGGFAAKGWLTEAGAAPWLAGFGLVELAEPGYAARTARNCREAELLMWFGDITSPGGRLTGWLWWEPANMLIVPCMGSVRPSDAAAWLDRRDWAKVLMVAGNRESKSPGIGGRVEWFLVNTFRRAGWGVS